MSRNFVFDEMTIWVQSLFWENVGRCCEWVQWRGGDCNKITPGPGGWNWGMLVNIWRLTAASHLFYYLHTHPEHHSVDTGDWTGGRNWCCSCNTFPGTESFNVQVDFCQWGNLEVPQPIRNVKFMLPSTQQSYLIRLRSSYTRTNYYNYSLGKFKSV